MAPARDLGRLPPPARERALLAHRQPASPVQGPTLPTRIGPVEFTMLGGMVALRCPQELVPLVQKAGGVWEPGSRRWLVERRRINPLIRNLRRATDPLFRRARIDLDEPPDGGQEAT